MTSPSPRSSLSPTQSPRELATRENDGVEVTLLWHADTDAVTVCVDDRKLGVRFEAPVPPGRAMHAFAHPFTYADAAPAAAGRDRALSVEAA